MAAAEFSHHCPLAQARHIDESFGKLAVTVMLFTTHLTASIAQGLPGRQFCTVMNRQGQHARSTM